MRNIIKSSSYTKLLALLAGAMLFGLSSQSALALGTTTGTVINNTATLQYAVGGIAQLSIDSKPGVGNTTPNLVTGIPAAGTGLGAPTAFAVDMKVNFTVSGGVLHNVTPGQAAATAAVPTGAYTAFTITNNSNQDLDFKLLAADAAIGTAFVAPATSNDAFNSTGLTILRAAAAGATLTMTGTAVDITATPTVSIAANTTWTVYVASAIPAGATSGQQSMISLQAQAAWGAALPVLPAGVTFADAQAVSTAVIGTPLATADTPMAVDVVFADTAGVLGTDIARDGKHSAYEAYNISAAALTVIKTATVLCDPINGNSNPKMIPGAYVQYAITVKNAAGASAATLTSVTDALQTANMAFDALLIDGTGAVPATACSAGGNSIKGAGVGFGAVKGTFAAPGYTAPGVVGQAVTAGAAFATPNVTITFATLAGTAIGVAPNDTLAADSSITVYFNAIVQ